jgi:type I restriction enzyme S subunit
MSEWKEYRLSDFCEVIGGGTPSTKVDKYFNGGIPWITPRDLTNFNKRFISRGERNITELGLVNSSARILPKNSILLTSRAPIGYLAIAENQITTNQGFKSLIVNPAIADFNFVFYLIKSNIEKIKSFGTGTTFAEISGSVVKDLKFSIPDLPTQTAIAEILSSLDDKIELNNKINQELEDLAQTLFKRWFIDFEFPNENGDPYKSSGGEMVDSELGEIPKGWGVRKFENIVKISTGKGVNKSNFQVDGEYPVIGANGIMGFYTNYNIEGFRVLTGRVGTLGTVRISNEKAWTSDNVLICEPFYKEYNHYSFFIMKDFDFNSLNRGSTQPLITQSDLKLQTILLPQKNILTLFQNQMDYCLSMLENNYSENKNLIKIRDTLLPKLISGELEVSQIQNLP